MTVRSLILLTCAAAMPAAAPAQTSIDSRGIRSGAVRIDASGIHTATTSVDANGVHAARPGGGRMVTGNDASRSIDCGGGSLSVEGNGNHLVVARCRAVTIDGNGNTADVAFGAAGSLAVMGNRNQVRWHSPDGARVAVSAPGTRNVVTRR